MDSKLPEGKRLKIAMVIDSYDDSKNGAVISTKRFVELLKKDHLVSVITTGAPAPGKILLPKFYPFGVKRIMKKMHTPLAFPSKKILRKAIKEMDIIHVQFPFFLAINSIRIAKRYHIPIITTFHIQAEHLAMNAGIHSEKFIRYCYKFWLKQIYNRSDLVICPSKFADDELHRYGLRSPTVILSNGFLPIFKPMKVNKEGIWKDKFIILSVGRFAPEKRHELIIQAIKNSKNREKIQLILIGEGPVKGKLIEEGNDLTNPPIFLSLSPEELVYYYNLSDLYIHAATVEVECMTVLEAMGCGLPVLIADCPKSATKQFALDPMSLFIKDDAEDLINKIDYWIDHPQELAGLKTLYFESSSNYRIEQSYAKLLQFYYGLIQTKQI
jgi:1,2-diacylglycerol 3-alpha-glucosyltransferase